MSEPIFLDLIRGIHLLSFALGMGPAIYFDLRSLSRIALPFHPTDFAELHRIHKLVSLACLGLWISGMTLIWWRTNFVPAAFSPKLLAKLAVVTVLTVNAIYLSRCVMPSLANWTGSRLIDIPVRLLLPMTLCAGLSLSCWTLALALGSSAVLKTSDWSVLVPLLASGAILCIGGVLATTFGLRAVITRATA